jgi:hypothetical protein
MSRLLSEETAGAVQKIREILGKAYDDGITDVFTKNRPAELWASIYALSRLQHAAFRCEAHMRQRHPRDFPKTVVDPDLLENLAHYAVYANAAYGSIMDVAFGGGFHLRDNLQNLLLRTRTPRGDLIAVQWDAKRHPAYFIVRDRVRKRIVLCLRGTWSPHDVLSDLCCEADTVVVPPARRSSNTSLKWTKRKPRTFRAHHGMLKAARAIEAKVKSVLEKEFEERPDYSLVIVGHSMGGGVAALLGLLWESTFPGVIVYAIGAPCVTSVLDDPRSASVISVVHDYDPFSRMSLGHVTDVSIGLSALCEDVKLRNEIIERTSIVLDGGTEEDLRWCYDTMAKLRSAQLTSEKLYPPGQIFLLSCDRSAKRHGGAPTPTLQEVRPEHFKDLLIRPRMFDLTRHVPANYIQCLRQVAASSSAVTQ